MTALYRVRTSLTGFPGGPGVATMYFLDINTAVPSVRAFWAGMVSALPSLVTAQVENVGDQIESTTGALTGAWSKDAVLPVFGTATGIYSAPSGAVVNWLTNTFTGGRRLRGRTFVVPLSGGAYDNDGSINAGTLSPIRAAASSLIFEQSLSLVVWGRPRLAAPANGTVPAVTYRAGTHGLVTASRVPDKAAVLRSRRD